MSKTVTTKTSSIGKKIVWFVPKPSNSRTVKVVTSIQTPIPTVATITASDDEEVVIVTKDDEVILTKDVVENLLHDTSYEEEFNNDWLQANLLAL